MSEVQPIQWNQGTASARRATCNQKTHRRTDEKNFVSQCTAVFDFLGNLGPRTGVPALHQRISPPPRRRCAPTFIVRTLSVVLSLLCS